MVQHLHRNFLTDAGEYARSEKYWQDLWEKLLREVSVSQEWRSPWLGAPLRDGNPIFSAVSDDLRRGVHVIQHAPTSENFELVWWPDKFGEEGIDNVAYQLVISCALSAEAADHARNLMRAWVTCGNIVYEDPDGYGPG